MDRSLSKNTLATLAARAFTTAGQLVIFALVAVTYGEAALDRYVVLLAIAFLGGVVADFGAGLYVTREVALDRPPNLGIRVRTLLTVPLLVGITWAITASKVTVTEGVALSVLVIALAASLLAKGLFWGQILYEREAAVASSEVAALSLIFVGISVGALPKVDPLALAACCYAAGALVRWLWVLSRSRPDLSRETRGAKWLRDVSPYGLQTLVTTTSAQLDLVLLSLLWTADAAGAVAAYAVALRVYYAAPMPLEALSAALLPRLVTDTQQRFRQMAILGAAGCVLTVIAILIFGAFAPLFGFEDTVVDPLRSILWVLLLAVPMRCSSYLLGALVTAQGAQKERFLASSAALITMVTLDLALIPDYGPIGAAWALVAADSVLATGYALAAHRAHRMPRNLVTGRT
jgi:O-antigen/teichoic acid export membrane protein